MSEHIQPIASQRRVAEADRQRLAVEARRAGAAYDDIARQLGYRDKSGAYRAVRAGLAKALREPADDLRALELARLDRLQLAHWQKAAAGDAAATHTVLKIMERRAKLLGLDAPIRVDVRRLVREIAARHDLTDDESRVLFDDLSAYLDGQREAT